MLFLAYVLVVFFMMAENIVRIFSENPTVVGYGTLCLRFICLCYVFAAYGMVISQSFSGASDTRTPTIITLFCYWLLQIPLVYVLSVYLNLSPSCVFIAIAASMPVLAIISIILFRKEHWKLVRI